MPKKIVEFSLDELTVDPTQYKPYSHVLRPAGAVIVRVPVGDDGIEQETNEDGIKVTVLNLEGFRAVLSTLADSMDKMHRTRQEKKIGEDRRY